MDPVQLVTAVVDTVRQTTGTDYCCLEIIARDGRGVSSFDSDGVTARGLTRDSFATMRRPDVFHCINNDVMSWTASRQTFVYREFRSFPGCRSLMALIIKPPKWANVWGTLVMGHNRSGHFTHPRTVDICKLLDAFVAKAALSFLTDLAQTILDLSSVSDAASYADCLRTFLKAQYPFITVNVAMLNAAKDKAAMFAEGETDDVKSFDVDERTLISESMTHEVDAPIDVRVPSEAQASVANHRIDVKMLRPSNPLISSRFLAIPLRKPKTKMPMMLSLTPVADQSNPKDRCIGMLYFEVHSRVLRSLNRSSIRCIVSLAPIFASLLSQQIDIAKEIERLVRNVKPLEADCDSPEREAFLRRLEKTAKGVAEKKRREWGLSKPTLEGLELTSVICQRNAAAILKGSISGKQVAVKCMSVECSRSCMDRAKRELEIARSVEHKNIAHTLDHKMNVDGKQILRCCPCHCPAVVTCPYHEIEQTLKLIVKTDVRQSVWHVLITEWYDETLSSLIHNRMLFALPSRRPTTGCRCVDWKMKSCWKADLTVMTMLDLAGVMRYLHSIGIIYGDLKPDNVLIKVEETSSDTGKWIVKLGDFGSSCVEGYDRIRSECTLAYCPPEFMSLEMRPRQHKDGYAGDIYSFGVMLWEMMMAKKPFSAFVGNSTGLQEWIEGRGRLGFSQGFPDELRDLIGRCWHHDPSERPSIEVVVKELEAILRSLSN